MREGKLMSINNCNIKHEFNSFLLITMIHVDEQMFIFVTSGGKSVKVWAIKSILPRKKMKYKHQIKLEEIQSFTLQTFDRASNVIYNHIFVGGSHTHDIK